VTGVRLDHVVIAVSDWKRSNAFYRDVVGAEANVARKPVEPGNSDVYFVWPGPVDEAIEHLRRHAIDLETAPVRRPGGRGAGTSVYFRDPDESLLEFISYA
jgi:catechol 2,3-dioxygenase-like lactoylglutathione lyase family enzyme